MNFSTYRKFRGTCLPVALTALAMGLSGTTHAVSLVGPDIVVKYGDLAIETEQGAATLLWRIESAAQRICSPLDWGTLESRANTRACRDKATAAAVQKVNHPKLLAAYQLARGVRPPLARITR